MPTYAWFARFGKEFAALSGSQQVLFLAAASLFVEDLRSGGAFRKSLRVKGVQGSDGVFEMSWAADGRATFEYGSETVPGEPHIVWRRVGAHSIFGNP